MFKYELHCHTGMVSMCGRVDPRRIVDIYAQKGYSGLVLTDHYSPLTFYNHNLFAPQKEIDFYLSAWRTLKEYCKDDFTVLLGMELRHYGTPNDYLIYGLPEEWYIAQDNLMAVNEKEVYDMVHRAGGLVFQAHPCRWYLHRCDPAYIDGIEVYNGKTPMADNIKAAAWAKQTGKLVCSGSDFHTEEQAGRGGIITDTPIKSNEDLLKTLREQKFELIKTY